MNYTNIEDLRKRLFSRMRNYTDNKRILKRYNNDLKVIEKEVKLAERVRCLKMIKDFDSEISILIWDYTTKEGVLKRIQKLTQKVTEEKE